MLCPVMSGECDLLNTEPLEHASLGCDSRYDGSDKFPILWCLYNKTTYHIFLDVYNVLIVTVLWNNPYQYFEVLFSPISLYSFRFYHSILGRMYFSILTSIFLNRVSGLSVFSRHFSDFFCPEQYVRTSSLMGVKASLLISSMNSLKR
jgi:hypothetical protein